MLVSPGRNVRHSDMQLLEDVKMSHNASSAQWAIQGQWDPREAAFAVLNQETGPDINSVFMTVAADLVLNQIAEPVRFVVETKVRIYPGQERFWYYTRRLVVRRWRLVVRRLEGGDGEALQLVEVVAGEEVNQPAQGRMSQLTSQLATLTSSWRGSESAEPDLASPGDEPDDDSGDEPILSGSGGVSKECSETELAGWAEVLQNWPPGRSRPRQLVSLVRAGVPEALRGEVWQRLSLASEKMDSTVENYRILVTKESPDEKVIFRDIHRTFPAHEFFKVTYSSMFNARLLFLFKSIDFYSPLFKFLMRADHFFLYIEIYFRSLAASVRKLSTGSAKLTQSTTRRLDTARARASS